MRRFALLVAVLAAFQAVGALAQDRVPEAAIERYLSQQYGSPGRFSVTAIKQFPEGTSGTGRLSVAATLKFERPTFVRTSGLENALRAIGFSDRQTAYYKRVLEVSVAVYDVEHATGETVPLTAEYFYRETVSGFELLGSATLRLGLFRENIPEGALRVGSGEFAIVVDRFRQAKAVRLAALSDEPLETLRSDVRRMLGTSGIGNLISSTGDALIVEIVDPSQKAMALEALRQLQTEILDAGSTIELEIDEESDGKISIRPKVQ